MSERIGTVHGQSFGDVRHARRPKVQASYANSQAKGQRETVISATCIFVFLLTRYVIALLPLVLKITKNYVDRKIKGKDIAPMLSYDPELQAEAEARADED